MLPPRLAERYRDADAAARYALDRARTPRQRRRESTEIAWIERALDALGLPAGARVLDLPAGAGRLRPLFAARGWRATLVDISPAMLGHAAGGGEPRAVASAERLPFADGAFDLAVGVRFLPHLGNRNARRAVLAEMARVSPRVLVSFFHPLSAHGLARAARALWLPREARAGLRHSLWPGTLAIDAAAAGLRPAAWWPRRPFLHEFRLALLVAERAAHG